MKEVLKKYWFVGAILVIIVAFFTLFIYNESKDKISGKKVDGKDVVAVFNGKNIFADDLYKTEKDTKGMQVISMLIVRELVSQGIPTTDEMKKQAEEQAKALVEQFKSRNATGYQEEMGNALKKAGYANGFSDLNEYTLVSLKTTKMIENYITAHGESYFADIEENKGRVVSHILVEFPRLSEEEKAGKSADEIKKLQEEKNASAQDALKERMDKIDEELKTKDFATVASENTDDPGSKSTKGSLGYVDKNTSFVKEFLDASMALNEEEVSDWVKTQYGYHKIKVDTAGKEKLLAIPEVKEKIIKLITEKDQTLSQKAIKELLEKYPVTTEDETVKKVLESITKE